MEKRKDKTQMWVIIAAIVVFGAVTIAALAFFSNGVNAVKYGSLGDYGMMGAYGGMMSHYANYSGAGINGVTMQGC